MVAIRLTPLAERHLDAVTELIEDPAARRFTRIPEPPPPDFARSWLERYESGRRSGTSEIFAIEDPATGGFLGLAVVPSLDRATATAELGYMLLASARGRGVATAAVTELTAWAFAQGIERIELLISVLNEPSKRVAVNCGYRYEGTHRSVYLKAGIREDTERWSRLATD